MCNVAHKYLYPLHRHGARVQIYPWSELQEYHVQRAHASGSSKEPGYAQLQDTKDLTLSKHIS